MKKIFKNIISIILTQESGNKINTSIYKFKNKYKWIFRLLYGTANDEELYNSITEKLNEQFDILMIHSSLNAMVPMYNGNLNKLLSLIVAYCNQHNLTLVMPTFFLGSIFQAKEHYKNSKNIFDVNRTISGMGLLTEMFRRMPDVKRSIHPTHSVCAIGPLADELVSNHYLAETTFGEGTPFDKMTKYRTMILGIGTKIHQALTQVHTAEDLMKNEYPIPLVAESIPVNCIVDKGNSIVYNLRVRKPEYVLDVKNVHKILKDKVMEWNYKGIHFLLTKANVVTETVIEAARNGQTVYKKV